MIGALVGAAGSIMSGMAAQATAKYNAKVAEENAKAAAMEGFAQAGQTADQYRDLRGEQNAAIAKSGADPSSGSALAIGLETEKRRQFAMQTDIWRGRTEQTKFQNQAGQFKAEGKAAMISGVIGGFTSLLGGFKGAGQGSPLSLGSGGLYGAAPSVGGPVGAGLRLDPAGRIIGGI